MKIPPAALVVAAVACVAAPSSALELTLKLPPDASPAARVAAGKVVATILAEEARIETALGAAKPKTGDRRVTVTVRDMPGVAHAVGSDLTFALRHLEKNPDDAAGVAVHELTHVVQNYGANGGGANGWITEGIADYVRFGLFEGGRYGIPNDPKTQRYDQGYRVTGRFLGWCESRHPGLLKALNAALVSGGAGRKTWETHCGASLDELWRRFAAAS